MKADPKAEAAVAPAAGGKSKLFIMIGAAVLVLGLGGGAGWYFLHGSAEEAPRSAKKEHGEQQEKEEGRASARVPADRAFTVNLQPENGDQYLQVAFTLQVDGAEQAEVIKTNMAKVRSRVLLLLSGKKAPEINTVEGKQQLAGEILAVVKQPFAEHGDAGSLGRPVHLVHHPVSRSMADNFLSQEEVDALLKGVNGDQDDVAAPEDTSGVRTYNLATQERIVRGRMPTLEIINERFARYLRVGLFNFLRRSAEVSVGSVRVSKYSEFIRNLVVPTNLNLIHMKPLRGTALMVFDPGLVFLLVDNLFGGDGRFHTRVEGRDFTQTEQRIIMRILDIVFEAYAKSWEPVYPIEFEYIRSEMNTQFANIATPNEVVVSSTFTVELGSVSGQIHFCMPYSMIEPIRDALTSSLQGEALEVDKRWIRLMTQQIQVAEVELVAMLGHGKANFDEILNMKVGDVIPISVPEMLQATVDGVPVMDCSYGVSNGQYALKVEKLLANSDTFNK
jgi:flagellar motor switch protein FliM